MQRAQVAPMEIDSHPAQQRRSIFDVDPAEEANNNFNESLPMDLDSSSPVKPSESTLLATSMDITEQHENSKSSNTQKSLSMSGPSSNVINPTVDSNSLLLNSSGSKRPDSLTIVQPITYHFYNQDSPAKSRPPALQDSVLDQDASVKVHKLKSPSVISLVRTLIPLLVILMPLCLIIYDYTIKRSQLISQELTRQHECINQYTINRCHPDSRVPALDQQCKQWEHCMSSQLEVAGWRILAECMADFIEAFVGNVSYKSIAFILACFYIYAVGFGSSSTNKASSAGYLNNSRDNNANGDLGNKKYNYKAPRSNSKSEMMKYRRRPSLNQLSYQTNSDSDD